MKPLNYHFAAFYAERSTCCIRHWTPARTLTSHQPMEIAG